jgi:hypothetical protein
VSFCVGCGQKVGERDSFCIQCGTRQAQFGPNLRRVKTQIVESAKTLPTQAIGVTRRTTSVLVDSFRYASGGLKRLVNVAKSHPLRSSAILLVSVYGLIFLSSFVWLSPKMFVTEYVNAVAEKKVSKLADKAYFPRDAGVEVASEVLLDAITVNSKEFVVESDWSPTSWEVSTNVVWADGEEQPLQVSPRLGFRFGFLVRDWQMMQTAPVVTLRELPGAIGEQKISIGQEAFSGVNDPEFVLLLDKPVVMFPGLLSIRYSEYGFAAGEVKSVEVPRVGSSVEIPIGPDFTLVPTPAEGASLSQVEESVSSCAKSKCSDLPNFFDFEFTWDDSTREYKTFYDSKFVSTTYTASQCASVGLVSGSSLSATVEFSCLISARRMETYVKYYYYISDDYDFYFGSASKPMTVQAKMKYDPVQDKFEVEELKMGGN